MQMQIRTLFSKAPAKPLRVALSVYQKLAWSFVKRFDLEQPQGVFLLRS